MTFKDLLVGGILILLTSSCIPMPGENPDLPPPFEGSGSLIPGTPFFDDIDSEKWYTVYFTDPAGPSAESFRGGPDAALAEAIDQARLSVEVATDDFDLWRLRDALIAAHRRGVVVRVVAESDNLAVPELQALMQAGIPIVGDRSEGLMHNKFVIRERSSRAVASRRAHRGTRRRRTLAPLACGNGSRRALRALLQSRPQTDAADLDGITPLAAAAKRGDAAAVAALLVANARVDTKSRLGNSPLHLAATHAIIIRHLISAGADLDALNDQGETALFLAARAGATEAVSALLAGGASTAIRNRQGEHAAALARVSGYDEVADLIERRAGTVGSLLGIF